MTTFTNQTKNVITPSSSNKGGYALWGDDVVTWGDADFGWGSPYFSMVNLAKNSITPVNKAKS